MSTSWKWRISPCTDQDFDELDEARRLDDLARDISEPDWRVLAAPFGSAPGVKGIQRWTWLGEKIWQQNLGSATRILTRLPTCSVLKDARVSRARRLGAQKKLRTSGRNEVT